MKPLLCLFFIVSLYGCQDSSQSPQRGWQFEYVAADSLAPNTTIHFVYAHENYNLGDDIVSFADGYPFLIIGESSMQDLNNRLGVPLSIRRFRTNFVFSGGAPFVEDSFKNFSIGDVDFVGVKPCARCVLTTRDPDSGVKGREPLATLQAYRSHGTKILFGQNVVFDAKKWSSNEQPIVKIGDSITLFS